MLNVLLMIIFIALALMAVRDKYLIKIGQRYQAKIFLFMAIFSFAAMSFYIVPQDQIGHLKRIYLAENLPEGRIIALKGQKGPQADILGPGFHFIPFVRLLYDVEDQPVVTITEGKLAILTANDGEPLNSDQFIARTWGRERLDEMLDAKTFLTAGGQRGVQETVLSPGQYRLNRYLFDVSIEDSLDVPAGFVAVIKSNVAEIDDCPPVIPKSTTDTNLATPIVKRGCIGVWDEPLTPGRYYLNTRAYTATLVPTTVQTWTYRGGYTTRKIDLTLDEKGNIEQKDQPIKVDVPEGVADRAIIVTSEGWRVPIELRMLVQVNPADAPRVVASVGTLNDVENKIATPGIRSILRNVAGRNGRKVMELINDRPEIEKLSEKALSPELTKAGVTLKEIRLGDPVIPPELLVARQREQLASQLEATYAQEKISQEKRISVEKARSLANEQQRLVAADINVAVAERTKQELHLKGEGEKLRLMEIADGNEAQANVLGKESALELAITKILVEAAVENPEIVKFPLVYSSAGGSLDSAAAILGLSNINRLANPATKSTSNSSDNL